jgi:hypothetical protein
MNIDTSGADSAQPSLFGSRWEQPHLDRSLAAFPELAHDHLRNASAFYGWAVSMAASGFDPCTPKAPMRLPRDWRQFNDD